MLNIPKFASQKNKKTLDLTICSIINSLQSLKYDSVTLVGHVCWMYNYCSNRNASELKRLYETMTLRQVDDWNSESNFMTLNLNQVKQSVSNLQEMIYRLTSISKSCNDAATLNIFYLVYCMMQILGIKLKQLILLRTTIDLVTY